MLRKWETPRAEVEEFMPNEYCSVCWGVACNITKANEYDKDNAGIFHDNDHCGRLTNQVIRDIDGDGTADIMQEIGTDGLGTLECEIFTSGSYRRKRDIDTVHPGDYIYWTTEAGSWRDKRVWHHQGMVQASFADHPNRS